MSQRTARDLLPANFPPELLASAWDLSPLGINNLAWEYPAALDVIDMLAVNSYVILGGDVCDRDSKEHRGGILADNWYVIRREDSTWEEYVAQGKEAAKVYIEAYHARNGAGYSYLLVFSSHPQ
jgi:immunity protein 40 of polymorphic toxin system